jgi:DNA repair protein SbcD/Mre11
MKRVTFIHAADLHLDSPMVGLKHLPPTILQRLQESTFTAFTKIVDDALRLNVDFVIIAGDLFDGEDRSVRAQSRFRKQMERLAASQIQVFIVHGNHDHLDGKWAHLELPENVQVFSENVEVKKYVNSEQVGVHLYGFSYPQRHVFERKIDDYIKSGEADFHIGILHGHNEGNSEHGRYAPFSIKDLLDKQFDYWALGHIHTRAILAEEPPIVYPGNIQGRNRKELGMKGYYHVTLSSAGCQLAFLRSSDVIWNEMEIDASNANNFSDIYSLCRNLIEETRTEKEGQLIDITIRNIPSDGLLREELENGELLDVLQEEEKEETSFVWPFRLTLDEKIHWNREQLEGEADFYHELFSAIDDYHGLDDCLSQLYQHPTARRFLQRISEGDQNKLVQDAENILVKLLYKT